MSIKLDSQLAATGSRFLLFPQSPSLAAYRQPEIVWVSSPPGSLQPGPCDQRMRVLDAVDKPPYDDASLPPWQGQLYPPPEPDAEGNFDYLPIGSRGFNAAHMFGAVRRVVDIWQDYFEAEINLRSLLEPPDQRIELIPDAQLKRNAQTGPGYVEIGYVEDDRGQRQPLCLNIDVVAHEVGHRIVFDKIGIPFNALTAEFRGFAESASDLVALITAMHFDQLIDHVLSTSGGNIYVLNELDRFAELSENDQIRIASNSKRMRDVVDVATPADQLTQPQLHELGEPLTGALFDVLVDLYQGELVDRGAITADFAEEVAGAPTRPLDIKTVQDRFDRAYDDRPDAFRAALLAARDGLGRRLALTWKQLPADGLTFSQVAVAFLTADRSLTGWRYQSAIVDDFAWREIGQTRALAPPAPVSGEAARRTLLQPLLCFRSRAEWRRERRERVPARVATSAAAPRSASG
jgi:hypothetical protein